MNEDITIIRKGEPLFDISNEIYRLVLAKHEEYTKGTTVLVDVLDGFDDLITTSIMMVYQAVQEAIDKHPSTEAARDNAEYAMTSSKEMLLINLRSALFPEENFDHLLTN